MHACPSRRVYILSESLFLPKTHKAFRVSVITHLIFTVGISPKLSAKTPSVNGTAPDKYNEIRARWMFS